MIYKTKYRLLISLVIFIMLIMNNYKYKFIATMMVASMTCSRKQDKNTAPCGNIAQNPKVTQPSLPPKSIAVPQNMKSTTVLVPHTQQLQNSINNNVMPMGIPDLEQPINQTSINNTPAVVQPMPILNMPLSMHNQPTIGSYYPPFSGQQSLFYVNPSCPNNAKDNMFPTETPLPTAPPLPINESLDDIPPSSLPSSKQSSNPNQNTSNKTNSLYPILPQADIA